MPNLLDAIAWAKALSGFELDGKSIDHSHIDDYLDLRDSGPFDSAWVAAMDDLEACLGRRTDPADRPKIQKIQDSARKQFYKIIIEQSGHPDLAAYASEDIALIVGHIAAGHSNDFVRAIQSAYERGTLPVPTTLSSSAVPSLELDRSYRMSELLPIVASRRDRAFGYALYWLDPKRDPQLEDSFLVAAPVEVTDDDKEVYPQSAQKPGYWIYCSAELIQDVVDLAVSQNANASNEQMLECLIHYMKYDNFLDVD